MPLVTTEPPRRWDVQAAKVLAMAARRELTRRQSQRQIQHLFPNEGSFPREAYPKHVEFFQAGADHRERLFMAANRVGKTTAGCYEDALHLTGLYDTYAPWWPGRRFPGPIQAWIWASSDEKIKETIQLELFGPVGRWGTGLIPGAAILKIDRAVSPVKDVIDTAYIVHATGGTSIVQLKSYKQGRTAAEGTFRHVIHGDEEMPADIYGECLLRTMDTTGQGAGMLYLTFTPIQGLTDTVLQFLPDGQLPQGPQTGQKYVVNATWDDVPHLSADEKAALLSSILPFQRDARTRGLPLLGAGAIYPVPEADYLCEPFDLPPHWLRAYAMDVGWNWTAAVWGAYDREADTWYLYHEYKRGQAEPAIHAEGIKAPGAWIRGVIDPAASGRAQHDGVQLMSQYQALGLHLDCADHAVEAGLYACWERLSTGRLKVFTSLGQHRAEMRLYRRDERGRIVKQDDHLMDCMRYLINSGRDVARPLPPTDARPTGTRPMVTGWVG